MHALLSVYPITSGLPESTGKFGEIRPWVVGRYKALQVSKEMSDLSSTKQNDVLQWDTNFR